MGRLLCIIQPTAYLSFQLLQYCPTVGLEYPVDPLLASFALLGARVARELLRAVKSFSGSFRRG